MGRLFGTDGIRGIANKELTSELAFSIGKATVDVLKDSGIKVPKVVLGMDTRISGHMLAAALMAGITSGGGTVLHAGVITTPAVAYLTRVYEADAGFVISASHNTFEYNGIKIFNKDGYKLDDVYEERVENQVLSRTFSDPDVLGKEIGTIKSIREEGKKKYIDHLVSVADINFNGATVALDCANGASSEIAPIVYERLGANVVVMGNEPNGININDDCGSTHPDELSYLVKKSKAVFGMAFDGDADRLIVVDDTGKVLDGDIEVAICARQMKNRGELTGNRVAATVMSNIGFHKAMEEAGIRVDVTKVGDRYVLESMLETGCVLGGEQSGHIIFKKHTTTGDGILSSIKVAESVFSDGRKLSEIAREIKIYPQVLINAKINPDYKSLISKDQEIKAAIDAVQAELGSSGRVLLRPSGTEPLMRVMIEGDDINGIENMAKHVAKLIEKKFNKK